MAQVSKIDQMKAAAVGGPTAAAEYAAAQKGVQDIRQKALADAGASSDFLQAPEAFRQAQATRLATPLDAQSAALGAQAGAAGQYAGAMNSAQGQYMSQLHASEPLIQQSLAQNAQGYEADAVDKLQQLLSKRQSQLDKAKLDGEKDVEKGIAAHKENTRKAAAADSSLSVGSYGIFDDVLKHSDDPDTASRYFHLNYSVDPKTGEVVDKQGNVVDGADAAAIDTYLTQALGGARQQSEQEVDKARHLAARQAAAGLS